jgi:hypothetical protein
VVDDVLGSVRPGIFGDLDSQIDGKYLVGDAMTLADIAIVSNFIVFNIWALESMRANTPILRDTSVRSRRPPCFSVRWPTSGLLSIRWGSSGIFWLRPDFRLPR